MAAQRPYGGPAGYYQQSNLPPAFQPASAFEDVASSGFSMPPQEMPDTRKQAEMHEMLVNEQTYRAELANGEALTGKGTSFAD